MFSWLSGGKERRGGEGSNTLSSGREVHLALYKYDSCSFCQRVFGAIDGLQLQIEYRDVRRDPSWRQDLVARSGRTQVPALAIGDELMFESADIVRWLREQFPVRP